MCRCDYAPVYKKRGRVHHYAPACFMSPHCSGYSICQANPNDLVGREMCHKAALMDEGEHGANDTPNEGPHARSSHL